MPQLSTSPRVRARIRIFLKRILECTDLGASAQLYPPDRFEYRWIERTSRRPKLVIKTKLSFLADLVASESATQVSKAHIREVLLVLQKKLDILEDNRTKTRGSDVWEFTLKLWSTSVDKNLNKFDKLWTQYKASQGTRVTESAPVLTHKLVQSAQQPKKGPLHNLTLRPESYFIDTQNFLAELCLTLSDPYSDAMISIVGPGGIGKTTLALELAYRCLAVADTASSKRSTSPPSGLTEKLPEFEVIVFASAQSQEFLGPHLSERWQADRTLKDIIREVLETIDYADGIPFQLDEQINFVHSALKNYKTLLILDNLETTENPQRLLAFVRSLPQSVKVILTSRTRFGIGKTISLDYLPPKPSFSLIKHQAEKKLVPLSAAQTKEIYQLSGGLPLAMSYSIGYLAVYSKLPKLGSTSVATQPSEMARYCVEASLKQLQDESAHRLLMAATLFSGNFSAQAATYIANIPPTESENYQELSDLYRLSLINKLNENYYSLHSLTKEFICTEFDTHQLFKRTTQRRWIEWYQQLLAPLEDDWLDWQDYSELEPEWSNVRTLMNWCVENNKYDDLLSLWKGLRGYTLLRGHWDERQSWMNSLISMAKQKGDKEVLAQAMFYKGQTLAHLNEDDRSGKTLKLFEDSWHMNSWSKSDTKFGALTYIAALNTKQNNFEEAENWLNQWNRSLAMSTKEMERQECAYYYSISEILLKKGEYRKAEDSYRIALRLAKKIKWKRVVSYTASWLAVTLLERGEFNEAERLINTTLKSVEEHMDKRSLARLYHILASLHEKKGEFTDFLRYAHLAIEQFEKLGMVAAVNQTKQWTEESPLNKG